ncbi:phage tail protein [Nocardia sp. NBC_01388]|uniref:Gp37-like protein n=1 Tax=Nocardia sp. NBC_01388 TaxID=2903596 RepID=UPI00324CB8B4
MTAVADLPGIYCAARKVQADRQIRRFARPLIRLWDGDWVLRGLVTGEMSGSFIWMLNESGTGKLVLPYDHYLAKWATGTVGTSKQNVHITVDTATGARWGGRLSKAIIKTDEEGIVTVELDFLHDYEELKHIDVWSNPLLPAIFQFPKDFILAGPSVWTLKTALFLQLLRLEASLWALPDDPMDVNEWFDLDQSTWPIVVAPGDILSDGSLWTVFVSRWKIFHEAAAPTLDFAQLAVSTRRWLTGDPPPWPGAVLRNGCLVIDFVDKSGFYGPGGTSTGGNAFTGLAYTGEVLINDFLDNQGVILPDPNDPSEYRNPGWIGTLPYDPWVIYRPEKHTGIQSSTFTITPYTDVQMLSGGHSMPGVNEAIEAGIELAGELFGAAIQATGIGILAGGTGIGASIGNIAETILSPMLTDVVLAWVSFKDPIRALNAGWSHYYEHFQTGADNAYTLDSLIALVAALWATRSFFSHDLIVANGAPFLIGDQGLGDFFLGDRVGSTVQGMPPGEIFVDQVSQLELAWDRKTIPDWKIVIGTSRETEDPFGKLLKMMQTALGGLADLSFL